MFNVKYWNFTLIYGQIAKNSRILRSREHVGDGDARKLQLLWYYVHSSVMDL